jgi:hypothetical protein
LAAWVLETAGKPLKQIAARRPQHILDAESFVAARWLTGETPEAIEAEVRARWPDSASLMGAALAELDRRMGALK